MQHSFGIEFGIFQRSYCIFKAIGMLSENIMFENTRRTIFVLWLLLD